MRILSVAGGRRGIATEAAFDAMNGKDARTECGEPIAAHPKPARAPSRCFRSSVLRVSRTAFVQKIFEDRHSFGHSGPLADQHARHTTPDIGAATANSPPDGTSWPCTRRFGCKRPKPSMSTTDKALPVAMAAIRRRPAATDLDRCPANRLPGLHGAFRNSSFPTLFHARCDGPAQDSEIGRKTAQSAMDSSRRWLRRHPRADHPVVDANTNAEARVSFLVSSPRAAGSSGAWGCSNAAHTAQPEEAQFEREDVEGR